MNHTPSPADTAGGQQAAQAQNARAAAIAKQ